MIGKLFLVFSCILTNSYAQPNGNFCGNIWGNQLNISIIKDNANISAEIFGTKLNCNKENYNFTNDHLYFSKSGSDCLNLKLKQWNACPCPPSIYYNNKSLIVEQTPIGNITLSKC